jgi:hypothetical protein
MAIQDSKAPDVASVDALIDENGSRIDLPDRTKLRPTSDPEAAVGATSPTNWWLYGIVGLAIVVVVLFAMQMLNGAPGTDVQPGSPTSAPVVETPAQ